MKTLDYHYLSEIGWQSANLLITGPQICPQRRCRWFRFLSIVPEEQLMFKSDNCEAVLSSLSTFTLPSWFYFLSLKFSFRTKLQTPSCTSLGTHKPLICPSSFSAPKPTVHIIIISLFFLLILSLSLFWVCFRSAMIRPIMSLYLPRHPTSNAESLDDEIAWSGCSSLLILSVQLGELINKLVGRSIAVPHPFPRPPICSFIRCLSDVNYRVIKSFAMEGSVFSFSV